MASASPTGRLRGYRETDLRELMTSQMMANALPSRPVSDVPDGGWLETEPQVYRHPPGSYVNAGARDHVLVLNLAGRAVIDEVTADRRQTKIAEAGCFSLTPAGQPVARSWDGRPEVLLLYLKTALVDGIAENLGLHAIDARSRPLLAVPDPYLHALGVLLRDEALTPGRGSAFYVDTIARAITAYLLRTHFNGDIPLASQRRDLPNVRLAATARFMREHLDDPMPLRELAERSGLSAAQFARAFRSAFGKPPHAYLIDLRLEKATALLAETDLPVTQIAFACGFEQSQYFASVFRRKLGVSPSAWRRRLLGGELFADVATDASRSAVPPRHPELA